MEIIEQPHFRYKDWPDKTILYFEEGVASLENGHDGGVLFANVSAQEFVNRACLRPEELDALIHRLILKRAEMRELHAKWGPLEEDDSLGPNRQIDFDEPENRGP